MNVPVKEAEDGSCPLCWRAGCSSLLLNPNPDAALAITGIWEVQRQPRDVLSLSVSALQRNRSEISISRFFLRHQTLSLQSPKNR